MIAIELLNAEYSFPLQLTDRILPPRALILEHQEQQLMIHGMLRMDDMVVVVVVL